MLFLVQQKATSWALPTPAGGRPRLSGQVGKSTPPALGQVATWCSVKGLLRLANRSPQAPVGLLTSRSVSPLTLPIPRRSLAPKARAFALMAAAPHRPPGLTNQEHSALFLPTFVVSPKSLTRCLSGDSARSSLHPTPCPRPCPVGVTTPTYLRCKYGHARPVPGALIYSVPAEQTPALALFQGSTQSLLQGR